MVLDDTVAAIATALGEGGIGIVRVSGPDSVDMVDRLFYSPKGKKIKGMESYTMKYGFIVDPDTGDKIDEVIVSYFKGPRSFTGEDTVEINGHGGIVPLRKILEILIKSGCRLAEPGEFTKRAFINGKLDLAQAESIIDIIRSKTDIGLKVAVNQLEGGLSSKIDSIRKGLLEILAFIEAGIDFPEEDIEEITDENIKNNTSEALKKVNKLIESAQTGKIIREGISTVIIGKPNVGKSSLLNALLREKRAIVTDIPGTTRDIIEEVISIKGIPVRIIDTAGIRATEDVVEKIGVEKSKEKVELADLVLMVLDASTGIEDYDKEILSLAKDKHCIIIINKTDLSKIDEFEIREKIEQYIPSRQVIPISVKTKHGIDQLENAIYNLLLEGKVSPNDASLVTNIRHIEALHKARKHLNAAKEGLELQMATDFLSIDIKAAWEILGEINGETVGEDLLDQIFSNFCIGK